MIKTLIIFSILGLSIGWIIWYLISSSKTIPRFSQIVSVKTVDGVRNYNFIYSKVFWDKTVKTVCYWRCRNYSSSSSSRWSSSRWGGK
jgi:hypothetical protein